MGYDFTLDLDLDYATPTIYLSGRKLDIVSKSADGDTSCKVTYHGANIPATLRRMADEWERRRMPLTSRLRDVDAAEIGEMAAREHAYGDDGEGTVEKAEPVRYAIVGKLSGGIHGEFPTVEEAEQRLKSESFGCDLFEIRTSDGRTVPEAAKDEMRGHLGIAERGAA